MADYYITSNKRVQFFESTSADELKQIQLPELLGKNNLNLIRQNTYQPYLSLYPPFDFDDEGLFGCILLSSTSPSQFSDTAYTGTYTFSLPKLSLYITASLYAKYAESSYKATLRLVFLTEETEHSNGIVYLIIGCARIDNKYEEGYIHNGTFSWDKNVVKDTYQGVLTVAADNGANTLTSFDFSGTAFTEKEYQWLLNNTNLTEEDFEYKGITFHANGGAIGGLSSATKLVDPQTHKVIPPDITNSDPSKKFLGWAYYGTSDIIDFNNVEFYESVDVYAVWQSSDFSVTFNANGGQFKDGTKRKAAGVHPDTHKVQFTERPISSNSNEIFVGWGENASSIFPIDLDTEEFYSSTELYAIWERSTPTPPIGGGKAIIIPSKYIYEIDDNKVIDNEVDNLEVEAIKAEISNRYGEIVGKFTYDNKADFKSATTKSNQNIGNTVMGGSSSRRVAVVYVTITPVFIEKTINIPKEQTNAFVESILTGTSPSGYENIKYTIYGKRITGITTATANLHRDETTVSPFGIQSITVDNPQKNYESDIEAYTLEKTITVEENEIYGDFAPTANADISLTYTDDITNLSTAKANEVTINGIKYWQVNVKIYSGVKTATYKGGGLGSGSDLSIPLSGNYEEYAPYSIEINLYGNTITLDLQDETLKIGNGQHIYSFSGNELMQTTNTDTVNDTYQKVIDSWKEGKEVATLRCAIANYQNNIKITIISSSVVANGYSCEAISNYELKNGDKIYYKNAVYTVADWTGFYGILFIPFDNEFISNTEIIVSVNENSDKMFFLQGDIVEPYVYGADGRDKPMATKKDGTPKQFKVISVGINNNNGITQDIVIQEV